jgi:hypothetical protein
VGLLAGFTLQKMDFPAMADTPLSVSSKALMAGICPYMKRLNGQQARIKKSRSLWLLTTEEVMPSVYVQSLMHFMK